MAIKTCKDCSGDVKDKFLSEAGEYVVVAMTVSSKVHIRVCVEICENSCEA